MSHFRIRRSNVWRVLIWKCYWGNFANWAKVSSQYLTWFGFVSRGAHCTLYGLKKIINQKIYDALRDLVLLVQVKIVKNTHERVLLLVKLQAATLRKVTLLHGCFSRFSSFTNGTKLRKASHVGNYSIFVDYNSRAVNKT